MNLQLIEVYIPDKHFDSINEKLNGYDHRSYWVSSESEERMLVRILVQKNEVEEILNYLEEVSNVVEGFETLLIPVQTYISKETIHEETKEEEAQEDDEEERSRLLRASRHELMNAAEKNSHITMNYSLLILLSAIVATVGIIKDSEAVVIGAMVIAPMIGPVISVAFFAILGDYKGLGQSAVSSLYGIAIVLFISIAFGYFTDVGMENAQYLDRTKVTLIDIPLGVASGAAGALAFLNRLSGNLVGVMVAVALLPPSVAMGMSIGDGSMTAAYGAFLLVTVNIMSILLAAVSIFSISGIRPVRWDEVQRANVSRPLSIVFVIIIVLILALVILEGQNLI
ncbi:TIGR00341 family protein [Halobacillus sp. SY10]|uniref:TIGR00341 family protein n=2 Tax=Halobacillus TaxID=45667 RepID=A0A1H0R1E9_HALAD|nr:MULTISPECIES: TIGR00341 family protein [Halobacillus]RDY70250.1 TIGR00341 family protein [Halobacillus trueperi]SDP22828.1 TIGR00341 family protein [Halobacillus aidingensis]